MYMFILEAYDDSDKNNIEVIATYDFDSLEECRKFAQELVTSDEEKGLDYAYFIVDEEDEIYNIWDEAN